MNDGPHLDVHALLSASEVADWTSQTGRPVKVRAVWNWHARGYLPCAVDDEGREIRDGRGRPRFRLLDAAKAARFAETRDRRATAA